MGLRAAASSSRRPFSRSPENPTNSSSFITLAGRRERNWGGGGGGGGGQGGRGGRGKRGEKRVYYQAKCRVLLLCMHGRGMIILC